MTNLCGSGQMGALLQPLNRTRPESQPDSGLEWEGLAEALDTPPTSLPRPPSCHIRSRGIWLSAISLGKPVQSPSPDQEGLGVLRRVGARGGVGGGADPK